MKNNPPNRLTFAIRCIVLILSSLFPVLANAQLMKANDLRKSESLAPKTDTIKVFESKLVPMALDFPTINTQNYYKDIVYPAGVKTQKSNTSLKSLKAQLVSLLAEKWTTDSGMVDGLLAKLDTDYDSKQKSIFSIERNFLLSNTSIKHVKFPNSRDSSLVITLTGLINTDFALLIQNLREMRASISGLRLFQYLLVQQEAELVKSLDGSISGFTKADSNYTKLMKEGKKKLNDINVLKKTTDSKLADLQANLTKYIGAAVSINAELKSKQDQKKETTYAAMPDLNAKLGKAQVLPNIELQAFRDFSNDGIGMFGEIKFFTGGATGTDSLKSPENLFINEYSRFGFVSNFNFGFTVASKENKKMDKQLGLNFGLSYLGKDIRFESGKDPVKLGVFSFKAGAELLVIPNVLTIYDNFFNGIWISEGVEAYKKQYSTMPTFLNFNDFGARFNLKLVKESDLFLGVDISFIAITNQVKEIMGSSDALLPKIKLGLRKDFKF